MNKIIMVSLISCATCITLSSLVTSKVIKKSNKNIKYDGNCFVITDGDTITDLAFQIEERGRKKIENAKSSELIFHIKRT